MSDCYQKLLNTQPRPLIFAERSHPYYFVTERHIQALWLEQKYLRPLILANGLPLQVLSPGIWNVEAGPDFRKAHFKVGDREYYGDVEIHLNDASWQQHGHHLDARYDGVQLHVSLWQPKELQPIITLAGTQPFQLHLETLLTVPLARLIHLIDLDLYPYRRFIGSGRCAHDLFKKLPEPEIRNFFQQAAEWRLRQKAEFFKNRIADASLHLAGGIAMALGYKNNSDMFLDLFLELQQQQFNAPQPALAWLMARCGFFEKHFVEKWSESSLYCELMQTARSEDLSAVAPTARLVLHQIRPLNHPIRRFVYMVKLLFDSQQGHWRSQLINIWNNGWQSGLQSGKWTAFREQLLLLIPTYEDAYWNSHYLFEPKVSVLNLPLMGSDLKRKIVVNTLLPLLQDHLHEKNASTSERGALQSFYAALPASKTGKSKYLQHRFFGETAKANILKHAAAEQGAYQLHYDFCVHFEASCDGCPFVTRYLQTFQDVAQSKVTLL